MLSIKTLCTTLAAATISLATATTFAQDLTVTAPAQDHPIVLTGATVHTISGDTIDNGLVGFTDGKISLVAPGAALARMSFSQDTEFIDLSGRHIYPGLFASMTRLGLTEVGAVRATHDYDELGSVTPEVRGIVAVNPDSTIIPVTRSGGVLLAGVFPEGGMVPGRAGVIKLEGWTWEDMSAMTTPERDAGLIINWPAARIGQDRWTGKVNTDRDSSRKDAIRGLHEMFGAAKAYAAAKRTRPGEPIDLRFEAMLPVLAGDSPVLINANDVEQIMAAVAFADEHGLRMILTGGRDAELCADLLIERDIPVIISGTHTFPKRADLPHDHAYTLPARLAAAGLRFAIDTSDRDGNIRNLPHEAAMAARYGLTDDEAIRAITLSPAEIFGLSDRFGSIESDKSATLIVTDGNVLDIETNVIHAFVDGRKIDLSNKQTKLRDKYEERYLQTGDIENN